MNNGAVAPAKEDPEKKIDYRDKKGDGGGDDDICPRHPHYRPVRPPRSPCPICRKIWERTER